jgi:hypothetical protein
MDGWERKTPFWNIDNIVRWFTNNPENDLDIIKGSVWSAQMATSR